MSAQQSVGTIQQSHVATRRDGRAVNAIAVVVRHLAVKLQRDTLAIVVGLQLLFGNLDGGRRLLDDYFRLVDGLATQPQQVSVLSTSRQCEACNK